MQVLCCPKRSLHFSSIEFEQGVRSLSQGKLPRNRRRQPPCGRRLEVPPSKRPALDHAGCPGTGRRHSAYHRTSCHSSKSSSDHSKDLQAHALPPEPCGPEMELHIPLRQP